MLYELTAFLLRQKLLKVTTGVRVVLDPALGSLPLDLWVTAPCLTALVLVLHLTSMALLCGLHLSSQEVGGVGQCRLVLCLPNL